MKRELWSWFDICWKEIQHWSFFWFSISFWTLGYQTHHSYHEQQAHKECETHYKTIYRTVIAQERIQKCEDVAKKICKYINEKVCFEFIILTKMNFI